MRQPYFGISTPNGKRFRFPKSSKNRWTAGSDLPMRYADIAVDIETGVVHKHRRLTTPYIDKLMAKDFSTAPIQDVWEDLDGFEDYLQSLFFEG